MIIGSAVESGLNVSKVFGSDIEEEFDEEEDLSEISRVSEQTWLREYNLGSEFWEKLFAR
jgi:Mg2+/Co2+ transporter CorC